MTNHHEVIETKEFQNQAADIFSAAERFELINFIAEAPATGDLIQGTGGLRKLRWGAGGQGKRGGARVITFFQSRTGCVWLITAYRKGIKDNLTPDEKKAFKEITKGLK